MKSVTAILTSFNRQADTLRCLASLARLNLPDGFRLGVVLVDDMSKDGTAEAVAEWFPDVEILHGNGNLYWCGGMKKGWTHAAKTDPDYYLLVNDDVIIETEALKMLLEIIGAPETHRIAVGAVCDSASGQVTYGGRRGRRGQYLIPPTGKPEPCDTLNANIVLIPRTVFHELGIFHAAYTHGLGDYDYGFTAVRHGMEVIQSPVFVGTCIHNQASGTFQDKSLPRLARLRAALSTKGLPPKPWLVYNYRNAGWLWPIRFLSPYIRILLGL